MSISEIPAASLAKFEAIIASDSVALYEALDANEKDWFEAYKWSKISGR